MKFFWSAKGKALAVGLVLLAAGAPSRAALVTVGAPAMDVYMYANASDPGTRGDAGTFASPVIDNEDRLGQYVMGWSTVAAGILAGQGASNYVITKVTLTMDQLSGGVRYDPTADPYQSSYPTGTPGRIADSDFGKPFELYGLGYRNGYTGLAVNGPVTATSFGESSPQDTENSRNVFAYSPSAPTADGDVSENVWDALGQGFQPTPFAIGTAEGVNPGDLIPGDTLFTFELNLSAPGVLDYLRDALNRGELGLTLSSLNPTNFTGSGGSGAFPRWRTRESDVPFLAPELEIEVTIVPEPSAGHVLILASALLASARAWRRRHRYS